MNSKKFLIIVIPLIVVFTTIDVFLATLDEKGKYEVAGVLWGCSQCDNKNANYLVGGNFDFEKDQCMEGFYESWINNWNFECTTKELALKRCMDSYPIEWMIKDGDLYRRTVNLDNPNLVICGTRIMSGYPADLDQFIRDYENRTQGL